MNPSEYIARLDNDLQSGVDIWEEAVEMGRHLDNAETAAAWIMGDIIGKLDTTYGTGVIKKYAQEINLSVSTVKERRTMAGFYDADARASFENISWRHYREAMAFGDKAMKALNIASRHDWPVWRFLRFKYRVLGKQIPEPRETSEDVREIRIPIDDGLNERLMQYYSNEWNSIQMVEAALGIAGYLIQSLPEDIRTRLEALMPEKDEE